MGRAIFISYRRDDTEGEAGRLFDDLVRTFGDDSVFMDVAGINPGIDFRKAIDDNVATCGVLLAMIGPGWATIGDSAGHRRLDEATDFVRLEIAAALSRNIAVIPVLVHDAKMPHPDQLPDNLKSLAYRNSVELTHARWNSDVQLLIKALAQYVAASSVASSEPVHAAVPVQLPPANPPTDQPAPKKSSKIWLITGVVALIVVIGGVGFFATRHTASNNQAPASSTPTAAQPGTTGATPVSTAPATSQISGSTTIPAGASTTTQPDSASGTLGMWGIDGANALTGTENDPSPARKDNELARLRVFMAGDQLSIHAWGACRGCDWGTQPATLDGQSISAEWDFGKNPIPGEPDTGRVAHVTIEPAPDGLTVTVRNSTPGRKPTGRRSVFSRLQ